MQMYTYQNTLIGKKELRQLLAWSFTNYDSMQTCLLADELKYLGFKYASQAGISISLEDLKIPFVKTGMIDKANQEIHNSEKIFLKGKITDVERFQKIIDTWSLTSESLKNQIIYFFKNYDPLNSVYIMAFSGARGNLSQVRQLVGMRGLMSDPSGQIMNLPIKKNFREGLTITDYLMSGYGARKGIVDTALKTANSGYLTRRLIDVSQDILIREKDCLTSQSFLFSFQNFSNQTSGYEKILGRVISKPIFNLSTSTLLANQNTAITTALIQKLKEKNINHVSIRSPLTCQLYRAICQKCYGWDLATENVIDIGEAIGILAGQSIGEPGTQLTMRTFHTGGIFTSEARQQIISPLNGILQFYRHLKTVVLRTNRGEDVLVTKNSGSLVLIPENKNENLTQIDIQRNTILFPKNNQYILKDTVLGEVINTKKQIKTEIKTILSDTSGEIFIPKLKQKINSLNNNRLIWILEGQLYSSPINSFVNFSPDYKLNQFSHVFRTKLITHYSGVIKFINNKKSLYQGFVKLANHKYSLTNSKLEQLILPIKPDNYLLTLNNVKYLVTIQKKYSKNYLQLTRNHKFGTLLTNSFLTLTGGTIFYQTTIPKNKFIGSTDQNLMNFYEEKCKQINLDIAYRLPNSLERAKKRLEKSINEETSRKVKKTIQRIQQKIKKAPIILEKFEKWLEKFYVYDDRNDQRIVPENMMISMSKVETCQNRLGILRLRQLIRKCKEKNNRTLIWLGEEVHKVKGESNSLFVKNGDFISKGSELISDLFATTSGLVTITLKNNISIISIKSGLVYKSKKLKKLDQKIYYPGEVLFSNFIVSNLSFCDYLGAKYENQFLVREIQIYEVPYYVECPAIRKQKNYSQSQFQLESKLIHSYKSNQHIHGTKNLNLISNFLCLKLDNSFQKNINIELAINSIKNTINFNLIEKLYPNNYIVPNLKNKNIQPCFLVQKSQFVNRYTILGYLEAITSHSLEIVKFKIKNQNEKQIFLISNDDCITVNINEIPHQKVGDFVMSKVNLMRTGKIIIENKALFTIQKGRPYFFPNCKNETLMLKTNLQYKIIPQIRNQSTIASNQNVFVNYYDLKTVLSRKTQNLNDLQKISTSFKYKFSKFFLKNAGKFYTCLIPQFSKKFTITEKKSNLQLEPFFNLNQWRSKKGKNEPEFPLIKKKNSFNRTILLQNSELLSNHNRKTDVPPSTSQLTLVKFMENPLTKSAKAVGIYSITEDFFERDVNSVFCQNNEFIESGKTIGFLNLEKEITGDIVQGLPRIEEIFEARKKNLKIKRIPTSQKKSLLAQKTSLDNNFEFKKIGTPVKENEKINPHKLVKSYFNYYGLLKLFLCDRTNSFKYGRLTNNYEASYKSFKKVQLFMLNSIQSVYYSQGVTINDKHLEIIIKQMTTKVLITSEGDTPLLQREIIDLYHIRYINQIIKNEKKKIAYYVPVLFGITKAALNNPSFISAASFQETTRVLTKAAIEGRIDWLRGLKENIIIGDLIPAGTGSPNYKNSFQKLSSKSNISKNNISNFELSEIGKNSRQMN